MGQTIMSISTAGDVYQYVVGKSHGYTQTRPTTVTATSYGFNAFVDATPTGVVAGAKVYGPLNSCLDANGPQVLALYSGGAKFDVKGYLNQTSLNGDFPNDSSGNYKLRLDTATAGGPISDYDYEIKFNLGGATLT